jgi:hypothetical protein
MSNHYNAPVPQEYVGNEFFLKYRRRILSKPMVLSTTYRVSRLITHFATFGVASWLVLFADYGTDNHIFHPVREWYIEKRNHYFTLSIEEELELQKLQQRKDST